MGFFISLVFRRRWPYLAGFVVMVAGLIPPWPRPVRLAFYVVTMGLMLAQIPVSIRAGLKTRDQARRSD